jgi:hypothetical protein
MKRSEMLEKIAMKIASFKGDLPVSRNDLFIASAVLKIVEENGMKPPIYMNNEQEVDYDTGDTWQKQHQTWEPEDET